MEDFKDASERHLHDAELLFAQTPARLANASHLFGISAECSLKAIAQKFEPTARFHGQKGHIPGLFQELQNVSQNVGNSSDLVNSIASIKPRFTNWNVSQRYALRTTFVHGTVEDERTGSKDAYLLMTNCLQGLI